MASNDGLDRARLPIPDPPFTGTVGRSYLESEEAWLAPPAPPPGAPNVVLIVLDDVGFGQVGTFGGPVPTPALDRLAARGLKYNRFHTTSICGPSRAALLTGRNHHNCGSGFLAEWATGFPSYTTMIPKTTATIGRILKDNGYNTAWFGKNHNTPDWESSVVGPFDRWPTGLGFDYFYGFIGGETHQYYPVLYENTRAVEPDRTPEQGYHLNIDLADRAIGWMRYSKSVNPDKPVFTYFAPGAAHAPHHAPQEWRERFRGQFDQGWDVVREETYQRQLAMGVIPDGAENTPRPEWCPAWDSLTADERRLYARFMENYAGFLAFTDHEIGRVLDAVAELPDADNTLVMYVVGDNGASSEGGLTGTINEIMNLNGIPSDFDETLARIDEIGEPHTEPHYPLGWAWAGNAPFQWVKQIASHLGGTRNPLVVSWPARIDGDGSVRSQFTHLIDLVPTILDAAGIPAPDTVDGIDQKPMDGVSIQSTFDDSDATPVRERQYFEIFSNRAIYDKGWIACAQHTFPWRQDYAPGHWENDRWELYNLDDDFSENHDRAAEHPDKLAELQEIFEQECQRYGVYPLDDRGAERLVTPKPPPGGADPARRHFTYYPGAVRLPETAAANTKNRSHRITVLIDEPGDGVLVACGGGSAGYVLYVDEGRPVYHYNWFGRERTMLRSDSPLPDGTSIVEFEFLYDGGGAGRGGDAVLTVDGREVARDRIERTVAGRFGIDTFGVGRDTGSPVSGDYTAPFAFTGSIGRVDIELGEPGLDPDEEAALHARFSSGKDY
ncbi:sulfatase-like hydrolase/transferase [Rhodococcus sp. NCIMB 12038]|uniref:sulfatase-like hydrolase/transferase n=1 Tax=Rhodococcus sp. NCIMB 12038 TaxID=933800 RepID=UPI000B3C0B5C|nr:sulfatase-like hydrolase/transferase [Rhodococcus sp. NCIMB 12038]OUS89635.1 arylsulfatase [Rhodococcus sp. NCIMB 12038]